MTQTCCPQCRLRFAAAAAAYITACPACGDPPQPVAGLDTVLGFRLFTVDDLPQTMPEALEVSLPILDPDAYRP